MTLETINDALVQLVIELGGSKTVGMELWPAKGIEGAQRLLLACLNTERNEKLGPDELVHLFKLARARGCHVGMEFLATHVGYAPPVPADPQDAYAEMQRKFVEATDSLLRMAEEMKRRAPVGLRSAA